MVSAALLHISAFAGDPGRGIGYPSGFQKQKPTVAFTENKGQISDQNYQPRPDVLYSGTAGNMAFHLKGNGISYQLSRVDSWKEDENPKTQEKIKRADQTTIYRVDMNWLGTNPNFTKVVDKTVAGTANYYLPTCPDGALNVKTFTGVTFKNIYSNIDLHYYEKNGSLKYDYIVAPGADYKQIKWEIAGAEISLNKKGGLMIKTPLGTIEEGAPLVFQNGKQLKAKWVISGKTVSYQIENYDSKVKLVIDPVVKVWGTYFGGESSQDLASDCEIDNVGNILIAGHTESVTGIATVGAYQTVYQANYDTFLSKFSNSGSLLWATYYGGTSTERGFGCAFDQSGNAFLVGRTESIGLSTAGSHQPNLLNSSENAFLVKFNNLGVRQWATYYGGGNTIGNDCEADAAGAVYLVGQTQTATDISTPGSHQVAYSAAYDGFLVKFNSAGIRIWGTYFGSTLTDVFDCVTLDATGNIYATGHTQSTSGIATSGSHQSTHGGGTRDGLIVKFTSSGSRLWSTYYGGSGTEVIKDCDTDLSGNTYVTGYSLSSNNIASVGSHQTIFGGGGSSGDAFLAKFNASGVRQWGTYYGGSDSDDGVSCAIDAEGNVLLGGDTQSTNAIATPDAYQLAPFNNDFFVAKFTANGVRLSGTYVGGMGSESMSGIVIDNSGNVLIAGSSSSPTGIATAGAYQETLGGTNDVVLIKLRECNNTTSTITASHCSTYTVPSGDETYTVSGTYTDTIPNATGCDSIITINLTISDLVAPVANVASLANVTSQCSVASLTAPTATDNCAGTVTGTTSTTFPIATQGTTVVTWTYNDGHGNTSTQTQNIVITDNIAPVANVASLANVTSQCSVASLTAPTATDNCAGTITGTTSTTLPIIAQGTTVVTWTYNDGHGNTSTQTQNVVITDNIAPVADLANLPAITGSCSVASLTAPTATDNCAGNVTGTTSTTLPITAQGTTVVTWTYNDGHGNTSTQTQNVVITDNIAPVADLANLPAITGSCSVTSLIAPTATDNCAGTITGTTSTTLPITAQGTTVVTWTYNDGHGNTSTQSQNVVITDNLAPVADLANLPAITGSCSVASITAPTATDNCAGTITGTTTTTFPITVAGNTTVTWIFNDGHGNTSMQTQNVTVTVPVATTTLSGLTITATTSGAAYQWINCGTGNTPISGATSQSFTATANGTYAVIVTQSGCSTTSACVTIAAVGIEEKDLTEMRLFPNPTYGTVTLSVEKELSNASIRLISTSGQLINELKAVNGMSVDLDLSGQAPGMYFIEVQQADEIFQLKVNKQ